MNTDEALRLKVIDQLDWEPGIDASAIGVAVDSGIVTLFGLVASLAEKRSVEATVARVKGVRGIAQEMEVSSSGQKHVGDEELAKRAIDILARETKIPGGSVQVKVEKGWITLSGEVEWLFQKTTAENAIYKLTEAVGVINRIEVKPKVRSQDVMNRIECALERSADLGPQRITVHVDGTHVILRGNVRSWHEREAAERAARSSPGVSDVDDELVII